MAVLQFDKDLVSLQARLFLANMIHFESRFEYFPFGRELNKYIRTTYGFDLPIQRDATGTPVIVDTYQFHPDGYIPDWQFMEDFIRSLNHKPLTTANSADSVTPLDVSTWEEFAVSKVFDLKYGVNLALNACMESDDPDAINFVSRTESNDGVSAYIEPVPGVEPQEAGLISVATGGSVLSSFVHPEPFYSGRDLYVLKPTHSEVSVAAKLFLITVLEANKFKYNYERQAIKSLPTIKLRLPIQRDGNGAPVIDAACQFHPDGYVPDWQLMEEYMRSLPYGDRIPEVGESWCSSVTLVSAPSARATPWTLSARPWRTTVARRCSLTRSAAPGPPVPASTRPWNTCVRATCRS